LRFAQAMNLVAMGGLEPPIPAFFVLQSIGTGHYLWVRV